MPSYQILPRIRIVRGREIALGPGKVELLEHIAQTGSLRKAAAAMDMSYMRAWTLVRTMNRCFRKPVVVMSRGGADGGRAIVTDNGKAAMTLYRRIEAQSLRATRTLQKELSRQLR
ncbi:MAG TPA: LysR family transcriptional regulator [Verrucomicrobiae bacterium]|nr:LysR family transcriptional regulator [Verrucomicrobiae bacterium]